ncbi:hypothetical protein A3Q56_00864 [Intoshia linei]|uniref:5'-3' exoribonuclease n=1 Tax=Intoshia linei TaxID=1819745 RepID=A0A177BCN1_9BILA|nr:hypothetical protein A3Q56_00864 [Intoshia linei]
MGVPAFFRWLSKKYMNIVQYSIEEREKFFNGEKITVDGTKPNPNGVEYDTLYLDMNGIIHPCCHPEHKEAPKNEQEMMMAIFEYIDRLMKIVRPRKLLFMAIDGVAPRAKMNQQRSRRFRSAKEGSENIQLREAALERLKADGVDIEKFKKDQYFDSNCITPGTEFMMRLADYLQYYITIRIESDPMWKDLEIILSDATVPGEGEHKIMDYIRSQRVHKDYNPNLNHCLNGADADLIMLGLATHEVSFTIIREEFKYGVPSPCGICSQIGHTIDKCKGETKERSGFYLQDDDLPQKVQATFIFVKLAVLREYLMREFTVENIKPSGADFERLIDDWVFLCFFVGNDFLPHLPSLQIREGAINRLIGIYKRIVIRTKQYLTDSGKIDLILVEKLMKELGSYEDEIFKTRRKNDLDYRIKKKSGFFNKNRNNPSGHLHVLNQPTSSSMLAQVKQTSTDQRLNLILEESGSRKRMNDSSTSEETGSTPKMSKIDSSVDSDEEVDNNNNIRLWEEGWRERYYKNKFKVELADVEFRKTVTEEYVVGLSWVLLYYYQGCKSWDWFYPFHYAPFASDFKNISHVDITFQKTEPVFPLTQLMSVFPAGSSKFLPKPYATLMKDPNSAIIDFYPINFQIDLNGKKFAWQGVALLPFVDKKRLEDAIDEVKDQLTPGEEKRNRHGSDLLFVGKRHPSYKFMNTFLNDDKKSIKLNSNLFGGTAGIIKKSASNICPASILVAPNSDLPNLENITCIGLSFEIFRDVDFFEAKLLPGAKIPEETIRASFLTYRGNRNNRGQNESFQRHVNNALPRDVQHRSEPSYRNSRNQGIVYIFDSRFGYNKQHGINNHQDNRRYNQSYSENTNYSYNNRMQRYHPQNNRNGSYNNNSRYSEQPYNSQRNRYNTNNRYRQPRGRFH